MTFARRLLVVALLGLSVLYAAWFASRSEWFALGFFGLPPLCFAIALVRGGTSRTAFWAGVIALLWFSHGVMVAWTRPAERAYALGEIALALVIVFSASVNGLRARFSKGR
ncbi:MAG: hypothetical protein JWL98_1371 [Xanthomonadaceae bacterium]|nr:hypothetical protein [Xanthomonadaceae bacterium]